MRRKRRLGPARGRATHRVILEFHLLGDAERVVDLDTKVTDGAFELCVPEQELNRSQIAVFLYICAALVRRIDWVP